MAWRKSLVGKRFFLLMRQGIGEAGGLLSLRRGARLLAGVFLAACLSAGAPECGGKKGGQDMQPVLEVSPQQVLVGDVVSVKASGLSRGEGSWPSWPPRSSPR